MLPTAYLAWVKNLSPELHRPGAVNFCSSATRPNHTDVSALLNPKRKSVFTDPVFQTPAEWGHPGLHKAIAAAYRVPAKNLLTVDGASLAMFLVCRGLLQRQETALVEWPTYEPFLAAVEAAYAQPLSLWRDPRTMHLSPALLETMLRRTGARAVILSNPHNPSGVLLSNDVLHELATVAARFDAPLIVDEVFRDLVPGAGATFRVHENIVAINSLSKVYGLSSLRCSWITASERHLSRIRNAWVAIGNIGSQITEGLATLVLRQQPRFVNFAQKANRAVNAEAALQLRALADEGLIALPPESVTGVYFPRLTRAHDADAAADVLRKKKIFVVPGRFFGAPEHIRLGVGQFENAKAVRDAFAKLASALRKLPS
ncbi:MAG: hypothetical protein RL328_2065 [Acidobacteriota bacterium]